MESLKKCPVCGTLNSLSSKKCKCGYDFVKENEKSDKNQTSQIDISQQISLYMEQEKARSKKLNIIKLICSIAIAVAIICSNIYIINQLYDQLHITKYNLNTSIEKINTLSKELSDLENEIKTIKGSSQNSYKSSLENNICQFPNCTNEINRFSKEKYCSNHKCGTRDCLNPVVDDMATYCIKHKCPVEGCNNERYLSTGAFCSEHQYNR